MPSILGMDHREYLSKLASERKSPDHLTNNQRRYLEMSRLHPYAKRKEIAEMIGVKIGTVYDWFGCDDNFKKVYERELADFWSDLRTGAMNTMSNLVEGGDFQASKFVLETQGYTPVKKVNAKVDAAVEQVVINITGEDEPTDE